MENTELLNTLTKILFYKDMNQLKNYIQKNLAIYEDDKYILNQVCKVEITPLEQLYNSYNRSLIKKYGIYFDKYNVVTLKSTDFSQKDNYKIKLIEISKSKKLIAIGFENANISIMEINFEKFENNDILNINLIKTLNIKINEKEEKSDKLNLIKFSYDEKYLLVLINISILNVYEITAWNIAQSLNNIKDKLLYFYFK